MSHEPRNQRKRTDRETEMEGRRSFFQGNRAPPRRGSRARANANVFVHECECECECERECKCECECVHEREGK